LIATKIIAGIEYRESGQGDPVICLHGIGGNANSFARQLTGITGKRVIAWSMPGYGSSTPRELTFENLTNILTEFMDALGIEQANLCGQSIGGMLAMEMAARHPSRVTSMALIGTTSSFGSRDDSFKQAFLKARLAPLEAGQTMAEMAAEAAPRLAGPKASAETIAAIQAPMTTLNQSTWRAILECLVTFNRRDDLTAMTMPTCLIAGTHDQNAPHRTMEKMADKLPNAKFHLIDGAGHMVNQEAPDQVNAILNNFWANT
jgi:3-oxoadipate enol-lactonase